MDLNKFLLETIKNGDKFGLTAVCVKGADVNARHEFNATPLMFAANLGNCFSAD
jgi:hypothetical protein